MNSKKIIVAGATGLVGKTLCHELAKKGYEMIIVSRDTASAKHSIPQATGYLEWSDKQGLLEAIDGAFSVINLAGSPIVGKRWTEEYKKVLLDSRITTTKSIIQAIEKAKIKPKVLVNGSAVGYYGTTPSNVVYDETATAGSDFLAQVCAAWENEANQAEQFGTRVVCIRTAVVLDKKEGALPRMLTPFYYYVGGPVGSGKQWFPWVHVNDEVGIICFAIENDQVVGPINSTAPEIITNKKFADTVGVILHKPSLIPVPTFTLQLLFGEAAGIITTGVKISSQKISDLGYTFQYPNLKKALETILQ